MKISSFAASLLIASTLLLRPAVAQKVGVADPALGTQYVSVPANETTVIAPANLCPGNGLLTQSGFTSYPTDVPTTGFYIEQFPNSNFNSTNAITLTLGNNLAVTGSFQITQTATTGNSCQLQLAGNPPLNSCNVPLQYNQLAYDGTDQPITYYAYVTAGKLAGKYFTILSNTEKSINIASQSDSQSYRITSGDITGILIQPYWTLSLLFPASQATISFIPTTNSSNVMTKLVLSLTNGSALNESGPSFYFNSQINNWVSTTNPSVAAGDTIIPPGNYLYLQNTGTNSYPLKVSIPGAVLTDTFCFSLLTSATKNSYTYHVLPRNTPYLLSDYGFNNSNFKQSPKLPPPLSHDYDEILIDNGHGGILATYFMYNNRWYSADSTGKYLPVDPSLAAGTVFAVKKVATTQPICTVTNYANYNYTTSHLPSYQDFERVGPSPTPVPGGPVPPTGQGGD